MIKFVPTRRTFSISIKPLLPSLGMDARESNTPTRVECPFLLFAKAVGFGLRHQLFSSNGPFGSDLFLYERGELTVYLTPFAFLGMVYT